MRLILLLAVLLLLGPPRWTGPGRPLRPAAAAATGVGEVGTAGEGDSAAVQLQACYNADYNSTPQVFEDFLRGAPSSLYLHRVLSSRKPRLLPLTIFVGATPERLAALEAQCRSWRGPHASAIYVPLLLQQQDGQQLTAANLAALREAEDRVQRLFDSMEAEPGACQMDLLLLYEAVADPAMVSILPINHMRNAALLAARTPLVAMVDVDLAPCAALSELAAQHDSALELQRRCNVGTVWVMPAWETHKRLPLEDGIAVAEEAIKAPSKSTLGRLGEAGSLHFFAKQAYRRGHQATDFPRWLAAAEPYQIAYETNYEPWFIVARHLSPPYDIRFRGYGWNKVAQVALVAARNLSFVAHPRVWLVHRPHERSAGQTMYRAKAKAEAGAEVEAEVETRVWKGQRATLAQLFHRRVTALRHVTIRDMRRGTYSPAVDAQSSRCRRELPWWRGRE